jgi:hypothetical protein
MSPSATVDRDTIIAWLNAGATLDDIDHELLEPAPLTDEQRAVLWRYARGHARRRRRLRQALRRHAPYADD